MDTWRHVVVSGLLLISLVCLCWAEVLQNAGFEDDTNTAWFCMGGCPLTFDPRAREGSNALLVSGRDQKWKGAGQLVTLNAGSRYEMTSYVQFVTTTGNQPSQDMNIVLNCKDAAGAAKFYTSWASATVALGEWTEVSGQVLVPAGSTDCRVYFQTDAPADYLIDSTSLKSLELFKNNEFETPAYSDWFCMGGCTLTPNTDAYQGQRSVRVSGRTVRWNGAAQFVDVNAGSRYRMTGYVKFVTTNNQLYQEIGAMLACKDATGASKFYSMGSTPRAEQGRWYQVGGIARVPEGSTNCKVYFQTDAPAEYLLDSTTLEEVTLDADWKTQAADTIEAIRKATVDIRLTGTGLDQTNLEYEIEQTSSEFIWGSAVQADAIVDPAESQYRRVFNDNFEWAVLENALKWDQMEKTQGVIDYDTALDAIQYLRDSGKKVRGHCAFWGVDQNVQDWVQGLSGQTLEDAIDTRIQGVVNQMKWKVKHWDVNNENQHGNFFERNTGNANITKEMFQQVRDLDQYVKLYLNDFGVISSSSVTVANKDQAQRFLDEGVPINGIGVQGHVYDIDLVLFKARLDLLAETGLPILITELGINEADESSRASKLSDLLYLFFSHPAVEGVVFWGFWDENIWEQDAPLFNGPDLTPNAAGLMYQGLRRQWTSQANGAVVNNEPITFHGFKGSYSFTVKQYGNVVATKTFDLGDYTSTVDLVLDIPVPVVKNDQFESQDFTDNWFCRGECALTSSVDARDGQYSALVTNRTEKYHGLAQNVDFTPGSRYRVSAYVNLVDTKNDNSYQEVGLSAVCTETNTGAKKYYTFGKTPRCEPGVWYEIGGAEKIREGNTDCMLYIVTDLPSAYYIDSFTAEELVLPTDWKQTAEQNIEEVRKADVTISVSGNQPSNLEYELVQTSHEFVWGSAVTASYIVDPQYARYQEVFYENFEWGVLGNALKWKPMERNQGTIDYDTAQEALTLLRNNGTKVRGHCVFWAVDKWVQDWVFDLSGQDLEDAISTRINGVVPNYSGQLEHWDVNNENQHGDFFERQTGKTNITMEMFKQINAVDSDVRLYMNDYGIISSSSSAVSNKDQAVRMVNNQVPISGIGVQGHLPKYSYDLTLIKGRLDILAEAGLPILITELGVNDATDQGRADKLSDLMYTFFGHPSVEGLVIWGFWDERIWEPDAPLFNGPDVTPNAAGDVYLNLRQQWTTNVTGSFGTSNTVTTRGFKGDYSLSLIENGNVVASQTFTLSDGGATVNIQL